MGDTLPPHPGSPTGPYLPPHPGSPKCDWGGCRTNAVVTITPLEPTLTGGFDYTFDADQRAACRNHMAVLCEPDPLTGNSYWLVEPI